eukprot:4819192-Amphidinium_carterae.2
MLKRTSAACCTLKAMAASHLALPACVTTLSKSAWSCASEGIYNRRSELSGTLKFDGNNATMFNVATLVDFAKVGSALAVAEIATGGISGECKRSV